jgi:hypothetical protein
MVTTALYACPACMAGTLSSSHLLSKCTSSPDLLYGNHGGVAIIQSFSHPSPDSASARYLCIAATITFLVAFIKLLHHQTEQIPLLHLFALSPVVTPEDMEEGDVILGAMMKADIEKLEWVRTSSP